MTDFGWLRKIVEAKTPGPWKHDWGNWEVEVDKPDSKFHRLPICEYQSAYDRARVFGEGPSLLEVPCDPANDAEFIATMGTLADKMMDVIEAAVGAESALGNALSGGCEIDHYPVGVCTWEGCPRHRLAKALAALQAARGEVEK